VPVNPIQFTDSLSLIYEPAAGPSDPEYGDLYAYFTSIVGWNNVGKLQGPPGPTGPTGPQGNVGPQGPIGDTGPGGGIGPQGIQGEQGVQGPIGNTGAPGADGATGPQGIQGVKGDTGDQGPAGAKGDQGIQGVAGGTGPTGPQGIEGPEGPSTPSADAGNLLTTGTDNLLFYAPPPTPEVVQPTNVSPINGATDVTVGILVGSPFATINGSQQHIASVWTVATDVGMTAIVFDSGIDSANLESITLPIELDSFTQFFWTVAYYGGVSGLSLTSVVTGFTTGEVVAPPKDWGNWNGADDENPFQVAATVASNLTGVQKVSYCRVSETQGALHWQNVTLTVSQLSIVTTDISGNVTSIGTPQNMLSEGTGLDNLTLLPLDEPNKFLCMFRRADNARMLGAIFTLTGTVMSKGANLEFNAGSNSASTANTDACYMKSFATEPLYLTVYVQGPGQPNVGLFTWSDTTLIRKGTQLLLPGVTTAEGGVHIVRYSDDQGILLYNTSTSGAWIVVINIVDDLLVSFGTPVQITPIYVTTTAAMSGSLAIDPATKEMMVSISLAVGGEIFYQHKLVTFDGANFTQGPAIRSSGAGTTGGYKRLTNHFLSTGYYAVIISNSTNTITNKEVWDVTSGTPVIVDSQPIASSGVIVADEPAVYLTDDGRLAISLFNGTSVQAGIMDVVSAVLAYIADYIYATRAYLMPMPAPVLEAALVSSGIPLDSVLVAARIEGGLGTTTYIDVEKVLIQILDKLP